MSSLQQQGQLEHRVSEEDTLKPLSPEAAALGGRRATADGMCYTQVTRTLAIPLIQHDWCLVRGGGTGTKRRLTHGFCQPLLEAGQRNRVLPGLLQGTWLCRDLDFGLSALRTIRASQPLCCNLLPWETSTICSKHAS